MAFKERRENIFGRWPHRPRKQKCHDLTLHTGQHTSIHPYTFPAFLRAKKFQRYLISSSSHPPAHPRAQENPAHRLTQQKCCPQNTLHSASKANTNQWKEPLEIMGNCIQMSLAEYGPMLWRLMGPTGTALLPCCWAQQKVLLQELLLHNEDVLTLC